MSNMITMDITVTPTAPQSPPQPSLLHYYNGMHLCSPERTDVKIHAFSSVELPFITQGARTAVFVGNQPKTKWKLSRLNAGQSGRRSGKHLIHSHSPTSILIPSLQNPPRAKRKERASFISLMVPQSVCFFFS